MMTRNDALYYGGLMGGLIVGTLALRAMGMPSLIQLVGGLIVGVGCGYLIERALKKTGS